MNPPARPFAYPAVSPIPGIAPGSARAPATAPVLFDTAAQARDEQQRWNQWSAKRQRENAAFREKMRVIASLAAAAAIFGGVSFWVVTLVW